MAGWNSCLVSKLKASVDFSSISSRRLFELGATLLWSVELRPPVFLGPLLSSESYGSSQPQSIDQFKEHTFWFANENHRYFSKFVLDTLQTEPTLLCFALFSLIVIFVRKLSIYEDPNWKLREQVNSKQLAAGGRNTDRPSCQRTHVSFCCWMIIVSSKELVDDGII